MKSSWKCVLGFVGLLALTSCTPLRSPPPADRYSLHISDNAGARQFDVALKSDDKHALCISKEDWPNSSGWFPVEAEGVELQTSAGPLPAKSKLLSSYCPGGCGEHRIESGDELKGFIKYESFGDPETLVHDSAKKLVFRVYPYYCR